MTLTPGERYTIVYREDGEEKTALAHYRGIGTAAAIARPDPPAAQGDGNGDLHWFQIDGQHGYLTIDEDDLLGYEVAEGYT